MMAAANPWPPTTIPTARPPLRRRSMAATISLKAGEGKTGGGALSLTRAIKSDVPSGADVLKALERVAAQKAAAAAAKRRKKMEASRKRESQEEEGPNRNLDTVRPLCIKPEWDDRLEELQIRLQQLTS